MLLGLLGVSADVAVAAYKELNVNVVDASGISPLQAACAKGAYDCAKVLIAARADPALVKGGDPPLFSAVIADNSALVRILLEAGADVGQPNSCVIMQVHF